MCQFKVQVNLHCGHSTLVGHPCPLNPHIQYSGDGTVFVVNHQHFQECPKYLDPSVHSYLTCCDHCRGKYHEISLSTLGDESLYARMSARACGDHMTPKNQFKTCDRHEKAVEVQLELTRIACGGTPDPDAGDSLAIEEPMPSPIGLPENFEQAYLRFACGHGIECRMPMPSFRINPAYENEPAERMFHCGCYAGDVPKIPLSSMLLAESPFSSQAMKPVWEITGPCWKHCGQEKSFGFSPNERQRLWGRPEVRDYFVPDDEEDDQPNDPSHPGNNFSSRFHKVRYFVEMCNEWEHFQQWKAITFSGDSRVSGSRLRASSRYGH